jgi:hypothetical protein
MKSEPLTSGEVHETNFTGFQDNPYDPVDNYVLDLKAAKEYLKEQAYCKKCTKKATQGCLKRHPVYVILTWIDFKQAFGAIRDEQK